MQYAKGMCVMNIRDPWEAMSMTKDTYEDMVNRMTVRLVAEGSYSESDFADIKRAVDSLHVAYANDMIKNDSGRPVQYFNDINGVNYAHFCGKEWGIGDIAVFNDLVRDDVTHKIDRLGTSYYSSLNQYSEYLNDKTVETVDKARKDYDAAMSEMAEALGTNDIPSEETVEDMYRSDTQQDAILATRLQMFLKDADFYEYQDNMEIGETDEDVADKIQAHLSESDYIAGCIGTIERYADDFKDRGMISELETAQQLIADLKFKQVSIEDVHTDDMPQDWRDAVDEYLNDDLPFAWSDKEYNQVADLVEKEYENLQLDLNEVTVSANAKVEAFDLVVQKREELGLNGDEPDIPAYQAEELMNGKTREEVEQECTEACMNAQTDYVEKRDVLFKDVADADVAIAAVSGFPSKPFRASLMRDVTPEFLDYIRQSYDGDHPLKNDDILNKHKESNTNPTNPNGSGDPSEGSDIVFEDIEDDKAVSIDDTSFDKLFDKRANMNLPWTQACNDRYNREVLEDYKKCEEAGFTDVDKQKFFAKVYDSTLRRDYQGNSPALYVSTIDAMDGYLAYQEDRIDADLIRKPNIDFSKPAIKSDKEPEKNVVVNKPVKTPRKSALAKTYEPKTMLNSVENGVSNPDYDFDEWDDDDDYGD